MKNLVFLFILFFSGTMVSQSLRPGVSFTYLYDNATDFFDVGQHIFTINANLAYELSPRVNIGLQYLDIRTHGSAYTYSDEWKNFYIAGLYFQLDVTPKWKAEAFPELSINYGNICTCRRTDPFEQAGIVYVGYGYGIDYPITKKLFLDIGLHWYRPVTKIESYDNISASGGYILGLSYKLL